MSDDERDRLIAETMAAHGPRLRVKVERPSEGFNLGTLLSAADTAVHRHHARDRDHAAAALVHWWLRTGPVGLA